MPMSLNEKTFDDKYEGGHCERADDTVVGPTDDSLTGHSERRDGSISGNRLHCMVIRSDKCRDI